MACRENGKELEDGSVTVLLSTKGKNDALVPKELVSFLKYVENPEKQEADPADSYVDGLRERVAAIKRDREWEAKFMQLKEMLEDERAEGRQEGRACTILDILEEKGSVPEDISERIMKERKDEILRYWVMLLGQTSTTEEFIRRM